jgi:hypothetical protein
VDWQDCRSRGPLAEFDLANIKIPSMVRIAITQVAFDAIGRTMPAK